MSTLISQGGFGCVYHPGISCDGRPEKDKNVVSKLQKINFNSKNEFLIGKLITEITNFELYFIPVETECKIDLRSITDKKLIRDCDVIRSEKDKYTIMKLKYIKSNDFYKSLISDSHGKVGRKKTILSIVETFRYLLDAIDKLLEKDIVHFDLKGGNVLYNLKTGFPLIIDFGISISIKKLNVKNMENYFYGFVPEYYVWCLDIHIINYLMYETRETLTTGDAEQIATLFISANKGLTVFSEDFRKQYRELCSAQIKTLIGTPRETVIKMMLSNYKTWDIYSVSIMFLRLFKYMFPKNFHRNQIIILFSQILLFNIHPDPSKRYTIAETRKAFSDIFYTVGEMVEYTELIDEMDYDESLETRKINEDIMELHNILIKSIKHKSQRKV